MSKGKGIIYDILFCFLLNSILFPIFLFIQMHIPLEQALTFQTWQGMLDFSLRMLRIFISCSAGLYLRNRIIKSGKKTWENDQLNGNCIAGVLFVFWLFYYFDFGHFYLQYKLMTLFHWLSTFGQPWSSSYSDMPLWGKYLWETLGDTGAQLSYVCSLSCLLYNRKNRKKVQIF